MNCNKDAKGEKTERSQTEEPEVQAEVSEAAVTRSRTAAASGGSKGAKPKVVSVKLVNLTVPTKKAKPGPSSSKSKFWQVRPSATSPPPPIKREGEKEEAESDPSAMSCSMSSVEGVASDSAGSNVTTASGASKRRRSTSLTPGKRSRTAGEGGEFEPTPSRLHSESLSSSSDESEPGEGRGERGRGRPPTTGEGFFIRERKQAKEELRRTKQELVDLNKIMDGAFDNEEKRSKKDKRRLNRLDEQYDDLPMEDIQARMMDAASQLEGVVRTSKNLKGGYQKILKEAAYVFITGLDKINTRWSKKPERGEPERLKAEISSLKGELTRERMAREEVAAQMRQEREKDRASLIGQIESFRRDEEARIRKTEEERALNRTTGGERVILDPPGAKRRERNKSPDRPTLDEAPQRDSGEEGMEVDAQGGEEETQIVMPPRELWPVAKIILGGKERIIPDSPPRPKAKRTVQRTVQAPTAELSLEGKLEAIEARLTSRLESMMAEMLREMREGGKGKPNPPPPAPPPSNRAASAGARSAPVAPTTKGGASGRPIPGVRARGGAELVVRRGGPRSPPPEPDRSHRPSRVRYRMRQRHHTVGGGWPNPSPWGRSQVPPPMDQPGEGWTTASNRRARQRKARKEREAAQAGAAAAKGQETYGPPQPRQQGQPKTLPTVAVGAASAAAPRGGRENRGKRVPPSSSAPPTTATEEGAA